MSKTFQGDAFAKNSFQQELPGFQNPGFQFTAFQEAPQFPRHSFQKGAFQFPAFDVDGDSRTIPPAVLIMAQLGTRGRVGPWMIQFNARSGRPMVFWYKMPTTEPTPVQIQIRAAMRQAMQEFKALSQIEKDALSLEAKGTRRTNATIYASRRLKELL
jgi:hypothetical protein